MTLKTMGNWVYDKDGNPVAFILNENTEVGKIIEGGSKAIDAIRQFIANANSGSFKPKSTVKKFEEIIEDIEND